MTAAAPQRPARRPVARAIAVLALLLLGWVAGSRLDVSYLPERSFPELQVALSLHQSQDVGYLAEHWLQPLEAAIRATGGVVSTAGDVGPTGARLRVRYEPGTDARRKAARLESEAASLQRRLRDDGSIRIDPAMQSGSDRAVVLWLEDGGEIGSDDAGAAAVRSLSEALRDLPEVRDVVAAGQSARSLRWTAARAQDVATLRRTLAASDVQLGRVARDGRTLQVVAAGPDDLPAGERWVPMADGAVRFGSLARSSRELEESEFLARAGGRPGVVLLVSRDAGASPLALERALRGQLRRFGYVLDDGAGAAGSDAGARSDGGALRARFLWSEADPIEDLLRRLAWGGVAALLVAALAAALLLGPRAGLWQAASLPVALAAAANAFWLLDLPVDVTTVQAGVLALAASFVFQAARAGATSAWVAATWTVLSATCLPVSVHLMGRDLGSLLAPTVRAYTLVVPATLAAVLLLPAPGPRIHGWARHVVRFVLRNPWAVALLALAVGYGCFGVFGKQLLPRQGSLLPVASDVTLQMNLGEGGTLEQAQRWTEAVESHLLGQPEVEDVWGYHDRSSAYLLVTVAAAERDPRWLRTLAARWQRQLTVLGSSVRVTALGGTGSGGPVRFDSSLREQPETDETVTFYRFVLRSTDLARLRASHAKLVDDLARSNWQFDSARLTTEWIAPAARLELVPDPGAGAAQVAAATDLLAQRVAMPQGAAVAAPGASARPVTQRVASFDAPRSRREPPQLADLLAAGRTSSGARLAPSELFTWRETFGSPTVRREDGAFVLPVTVRFSGFAKGQALVAREALDRMVELHRAPGVDVSRPSLTPDRWTEERLRLLSIAAALPLLLFVLAAIRLSSLPLALAAMVPPALAVAVTAAALAALDLKLDEPSLLALGAALASTLPLVLEVAQALRVRHRGRLAASAGFHWLLAVLPHALVALAGWTALLVGTGWGLDAERHPWAPPLRIAGIAGCAVVASSLLVLPGLLRAVDRLRFYDRAEARKRARPLPWRTEGEAVLEVSRLTKVYGNGFRALHDVDFRLEPGIVGLLGPNGAGKTTLLRSLCGLLEPSRGRVLYRGVSVTPENLAEYRRLVGFLPQDFDAYEGFTAEEFLDYWALQRGIRDPRDRRREIEQLLHTVGLADTAGRKVRDFSGGMRRRIGIARSLLGAPPILIVDEPTTGLDVESRNRLRESLLAAAGERIILFSTHIASDVAAAASRILLLAGGKLLFDGPAGQLIDEAHGRIFETTVDDEHLRDFAATYRVTTRLRTLEGVKVRAVAAKDQQPAGAIVRPNLEEAYLAKLGTTAQKRSRVKSLLEL